MQFSILQAECFSQLGMDSTDAADLALVKRWLNICQQDIAMQYAWPFLETRESLSTVLDKTAGTVSVTAGATTVTGASTAFASTDVGSYIQFSSADDWYRISAFSSTTSITIDKAYVESTNLSAGTYVIRKFFYSLSSTVDRVLDIKNWDTAIRLVETDFGTLDWISGVNNAVGATSAYAAYGLDSSGNTQLMFYPFPSDLRIFEVRYLKRLTDMSADADLSIVPAKWHHVLIEGALVYGFRYLRKFELSREWAQTYVLHLEQMKKHSKQSMDEIPVLRAIDDANRGQWIRLPGEFPVLGQGGGV